VFDGILKVVSYNIAFAEEVDQAVEELVELEELQSADVILLQEMDEIGTAQIARMLRHNYVYYSAGAHPRNGRCFGNAILSRWPISDQERLVLPHPNPVNGQQRIATQAVVRVGDVEMLVYSVHTETVWLGSGKRAEQVTSLIESIDGAHSRIVVGGDFNTLTAGAVERLEAQFGEAGIERASDNAGATVEPRPLGLALDHIFVRGMTVLGAGTAPGASASDHLPLWVTMQP
jgi:endonuclease/exonuclease/phosphatase family metal-dependent hydrolase